MIVMSRRIGRGHVHIHSHDHSQIVDWKTPPVLSESEWVERSILSKKMVALAHVVPGGRGGIGISHARLYPQVVSVRLRYQRDHKEAARGTQSDILTPAVYLHLLEFLKFDIQNTGKESHCVRTR